MSGYRNYSEYTSRISGLIGIPYSSMTTNEKTFIQGYFDSAVRTIWDTNNWMDITPYGEARFAGNLGYYPNDLTKTAFWTATNLTPTQGSTLVYANPADGRYTSTKIAETTDNAQHGIAQAYTFGYSQGYQFSGYFKPNGRNYIYLYANDGVSTYYSYFNLQTGQIGTSGNLSANAQISQQPNGYWLCTICFTSASTAGVGEYGFKLSTDGSTLSYTGSTSLGCYNWGDILLPTSYANSNQFTIGWEQLGEDKIDTVYQVWKDNPTSAGNPRQQGYELTTNGIQIVGPVGYTQGVIYSNLPAWYSLSQFPVYLWYRRVNPTFIGDDYSASTAYDVDDQVLFTDSKNVSNFYKCTQATTAGQSPTTAPGSWSELLIPEFLFLFSVFRGFADWLRMDGQMEKAAAMDQKADSYSDSESDKQERQMGWLPPMKVQTHVTSQARVR